MKKTELELLKYKLLVMICLNLYNNFDRYALEQLLEIFQKLPEFERGDENETD